MSDTSEQRWNASQTSGASSHSCEISQGILDLKNEQRKFLALAVLAPLVDLHSVTTEKHISYTGGIAVGLTRC